MSDKKDFARIPQQELHRKMQEGAGFVLIDTLTNDHFEKVHIPSAKNACVFEVVFLDNVTGIAPEKGQQIIVYWLDEKSMDAITAADKLVRAGHQNVLALEGGLQEWKAEGYGLEGNAPGILDESERMFALVDRRYLVDTEQSIIEWTGRNPDTTHHGTIRLSKGEILVKDGEIGGSFDVDMSSIKNINLEGDPLQPVLISHLMPMISFWWRNSPGRFSPWGPQSCLKRLSSARPT